MSSEKWQNANKILERFRIARKINTDAELASFLGVDSSTVSTWKRRNSVDFDLIFAKCQDLNLNWLLTGDGEMMRGKGQKAVESGEKSKAVEKVNPAPDIELQAEIKRLEWIVEGFMKEHRSTGEVISIPFADELVSAGAPAYQTDPVANEDRIYLNRSFIKHEFDTFAAKVFGDSMEGAGIFAGDILIVDRRKEPKSGKIAVVAIDGGLVVKKIDRRGHKTYLVSANAKYPELLVQEHMEARVVGVVLFILRPV